MRAETPAPGLPSNGGIKENPVVLKTESLEVSAAAFASHECNQAGVSRLETTRAVNCHACGMMRFRKEPSKGGYNLIVVGDDPAAVTNETPNRSYPWRKAGSRPCFVSAARLLDGRAQTRLTAANSTLDLRTGWCDLMMPSRCPSRTARASHGAPAARRGRLNPGLSPCTQGGKARDVRLVVSGVLLVRFGSGRFPTAVAGAEPPIPDISLRAALIRGSQRGCHRQIRARSEVEWPDHGHER
jgi:hypothetical protein